MLFDTSKLGTVNVDEKSIITFPKGIPALENCTRFTLFHNEQHQAPSVFWLQSLDEPDITFNLTTADKLEIDYQIELSDEEVALLDLQKPEDAAVLIMLYDEQAQEEKHVALGTLQANIRNPLVINLANLKGLQKVGLRCHILMHNND